MSTTVAPTQACLRACVSAPRPLAAPTDGAIWPLAGDALRAWIEVGPRLAIPGVLTAASPEACWVRTPADTLLAFVDGQEAVVRLGEPGQPPCAIRTRIDVLSWHDKVVQLRIVMPRDAAARPARTLLAGALLAAPDGPDALTLRDAGFPTRAAGRRLEYRLATTASELAAIVALRTRAYVAAGKRDAKSPPMTDAYDAHALHIAAWVGERPVAAIRVLPWQPAIGFEHDALLGWPALLPPREESAEVMRAAVDPDARVSGASLGLFQRAAALVLQRGSRYLVSCAAGDALRLYVQLGGQGTGLRYTHEGLGGVEHEVFVTDLRRAFVSIGVPLASYAVVWEGLGRHLTRERLASPATPADARRLRLARVLAPLLRSAAARLPRRLGGTR